jgi:surfeit locus 1 family protein
LFALAAFVTFVGLGTWQIQRKAWKEALIATLEQRLSAAPVDLPPREQWGRLDPAKDEFRHVKFFAAFVPGAEALVYAGSSALRSDVSGPGYWVLAPARLSAGGLIVINRGFVPEGRQDPATRSGSEIVGNAELVGVMRWPEPRGTFSPKDQPERNLWFVRDPVAIASAKGWGDVAPFFIELESPSAARRAAPGRGAEGEPAQRASAIRDHLVWARRGCGRDVCFLASRPPSSAAPGMSRVRVPCLWKLALATMF